MGSIYTARWNAAKKFIEKVNKVIDNGYLVFNEDGNRVFNKFEIIADIRGENIVVLGDASIFCYFLNNRDWDEGLYITHKEWMKLNKFDEWRMTTAKIKLRKI